MHNVLIKVEHNQKLRNISLLDTNNKLNEDVKRDIHGITLTKQDSGASDNVVKTLFIDSFIIPRDLRTREIDTYSF